MVKVGLALLQSPFKGATLHHLRWLSALKIQARGLHAAQTALGRRRSASHCSPAPVSHLGAVIWGGLYGVIGVEGLVVVNALLWLQRIRGVDSCNGAGDDYPPHRLVLRCRLDHGGGACMPHKA